MRIAYCEDETAQAMLVKEKILNWCVQHDLNCVVDLYQSAEHFQFELNGMEKIPYDLLILDIMMKNLDGFSLARQIRKKDETVKIAFLTSDPSHVFEGYEINAWRYLIKPLDDQRIKEMMNALCSLEKSPKTQSCIIEVAGDHVKLALDEIRYMEVIGHYITLHCEKQEYKLKENFGTMLDRLNESVNLETPMFVKCHRSYAVNIRKVLRIGREFVWLTGNEKLPVSRGMYQQINQAFIKENV